MESEEAINFKKRIEQIVWRSNKLTGKVDDKSKILLTSRVVSSESNEILQSILETGQADPVAKDNYSKNYLTFLKLYEQAAEMDALRIYQFIYALLDQSILLPITADNQDTALDIFSTLNNRGLPLSDADIFKAKIYNSLSDDKKEAFIEKWKELDTRATDVSESIQQLFYYYMFYLRATEGDKNTTTPGLRRYYSPNKFSRLTENPELLDDLNKLLNIWVVVNGRREIENEAWTSNKDIIKVLNSLSSYPNEFWKYPVVIYYLTHCEDTNFEQNFLRFLRKLFVELLSKYIITPTINAVKNDILRLNAEIIKTSKPQFEFKELAENEVKNKIKHPHNSVVRMILKMLTYNEQDTLLPEKWEIEHIFPQKWDNNYFTDYDKKYVEEKIEHIGNKIPLEKKLNIKASNGYFSRKKEEYLKSQITITRNMGNSNSQDWNLEDIQDRDGEISSTVVSILATWNREYDAEDSPNSPSTPSKEDLAKIEDFKRNGWI